ncbi:glycoside hydrolase family 3 C-terminal domain-containing protein [Microbacterium sp.]|uniref:glycoside hydrolase family 3 protein n=1 Tax=Microbacterium sp. TaxID=51671 RepID=UPI003562C510
MTDPNLDSQIDEAIAALSLDGKIRLLSGGAFFALAGDDTIGLDPVVLSDGPTGVRGEVVVGGRESCLLPNASLLAQTWNTQTLDDVGNLLAEEAIDQETHVVLGPTINLHRTPLGGRLFEAFSEDPLLTGRLAAAYVRGLQRRGIGASLKHFLGNESETERTTVNAVMSDQALREVYLAPFQIVLEDSNPWTLMAAYNKVNGTPSTEHSALLNGVVKEEWGYDGVVVSDWFATGSCVDSVTAGLDLVMPGPVTPWSKSLADEVRSGAVAESVIDEHLRRILRLASRVGAFGEKRTWEKGLPAPSSGARAAKLIDVAARGMVVLKNENQTLPLGADSGSIAVIGRHGIDTIAQGGGSAQVRPPHVVSIADGIRAGFGADNVSVTDGVETRIVLPAAPPSRVSHPTTGAPGVRVRVFNDAGVVVHDRHLDVAELEDSRTGWLADAARIELSARLQLAGPTELQVGVRGPGRWHVDIANREETFEIPFHKGPGGGFFRPRSQAFTMKVNPGDLIVATAERTDLQRILGLVVAEARRSPAVTISRAVTAAAAADTAIVVVGNTPDQETEGQDKTTLALPGHQDALVAAVAGQAKRTVVIVNAATPVLMPWANLVDAILFVGLPGQEAGHAVAAALLGDILPEGRLVTTFPQADGEGPAWTTTPAGGDLPYTEGTFVGHRGWFAQGHTPAYWFGHGLGYTRWEYTEPGVTELSEGGEVTRVAVTVRNAGDFDGRETVQVYLQPADAAQPTRLIGWSQVELGPGAEAHVDVECDVRLQRRWDSHADAWVALDEGKILVGRNLGDVRGTLDLVSPGAPEQSAPRSAVRTI